MTTSPPKSGWRFRKDPTVARVPGMNASVVTVARHTSCPGADVPVIDQPFPFHTSRNHQSYPPVRLAHPHLIDNVIISVLTRYSIKSYTHDVNCTQSWVLTMHNSWIFTVCRLIPILQPCFGHIIQLHVFGVLYTLHMECFQFASKCS